MNLSDLMLERGVSAHELAKLIDNSDDMFGLKLRGALPWDLTDVVAICRHFGTVDISMFLQLDSNT
jgi:hypothetical protein